MIYIIVLTGILWDDGDLWDYEEDYYLVLSKFGINNFFYVLIYVSIFLCGGFTYSYKRKAPHGAFITYKTPVYNA
jgi:hypothetical protein